MVTGMLVLNLIDDADLLEHIVWLVGASLLTAWVLPFRGFLVAIVL